MKNKILLWLICAALFISCSSVREQKPSTLMWEIAGEKGNKVWALGSVHLADERLYPLDSRIEAAFDSSDNLALEILIDEIQPTDIMKYAVYNDGRTLETEVPAETYGLLSELFAKAGIPKLMYNKFKPWFAVLAAQTSLMQTSGYSPEYGIDSYFLKMARNEDKNVYELESLEEQMLLLEDLGQFTGEYLKQTLESMDDYSEIIDQLLEAWKKGDIESVEKFSEMGSATEDFNEVMERLNYNRNVKMVKKIEEYLNTGENYFVVVGAAHLIGKKGVISLLGDKYKIKRY